MSQRIPTPRFVLQALEIKSRTQKSNPWFSFFFFKQIYIIKNQMLSTESEIFQSSKKWTIIYFLILYLNLFIYLFARLRSIYIINLSFFVSFVYMLYLWLLRSCWLGGSSLAPVAHHQFWWQHSSQRQNLPESIFFIFFQITSGSTWLDPSASSGSTIPPWPFGICVDR